MKNLNTRFSTQKIPSSKNVYSLQDQAFKPLKPIVILVLRFVIISGMKEEFEAKYNSLYSTIDPQVYISQREFDVLFCIRNGISSIKEISQTLTISVHTTKTHLNSIYDSLRIVGKNKKMMRALTEGIRHGFIEPFGIVEEDTPIVQQFLKRQESQT